MKILNKTFIILFIFSFLHINIAHAMCTYQYFPPQQPEQDVNTLIKDTKSNYNTWGKYRDHKQCWNGHGLTNPIIKIRLIYNGKFADTQVQTGYNVSNHGALSVTVKNINWNGWPKKWNIEILNQDDNNQVINQTILQCTGDEVDWQRFKIQCV